MFGHGFVKGINEPPPPHDQRTCCYLVFVAVALDSNTYTNVLSTWYVLLIVASHALCCYCILMNVNKDLNVSMMS